MNSSNPNLGKVAMVLAAGLGVRMRPLTNTTPKPLIKVAGKPIIAYGFEKLRAAHVQKAVVNAHYLPEQISAWCKTVDEPKTLISDESGVILETGGGIAKALPLLGVAPFFVLNSDCFWVDRGAPALERLRSSWDDQKMDCLLLLCNPKHTTGYDGDGDFVIDADGRLQRAHTAAMAYIGAYLVHPRLFQSAPEGRFSMNVLWDKAIANGRLFGIAHFGHWLHVGTPEAILQAEQKLKEM
ncbi:MAG: nucleotidyltransferase family protein [Alphaproteobacteria bacterium]|nr:nucleotidyltransferase family protein [Alphaproteobacteria bacterium]